HCWPLKLATHQYACSSRSVSSPERMDSTALAFITSLRVAPPMKRPTTDTGARGVRSAVRWRRGGGWARGGGGRGGGSIAACAGGRVAGRVVIGDSCSLRISHGAGCYSSAAPTYSHCSLDSSRVKGILD